MYTANSMNCLCEAIGIGLPGNGTIPGAVQQAAAVGPSRAGAAIHGTGAARNIMRPGHHQRAQSIRNALTCDMALGCSTNTVLHLLAIAHEGGLSPST